MDNKSYLGDGVYVQHDGFSIVLTTEDGISTTNTIYLEPSVYNALGEWYEDLKKFYQKAKILKEETIVKLVEEDE